MKNRRNYLPSWEDLFDNTEVSPSLAGSGDGASGVPPETHPRNGARGNDQGRARDFFQKRTESSGAELEEGSRAPEQSRVSLLARVGGGGTCSSMQGQSEEGARAEASAIEPTRTRRRVDVSREQPGGADRCVQGKGKGMIMQTPRARAAGPRHFVFSLQGTIESTGLSVRGPEGSWELLLHTDDPYPQTLKVEGLRATLPAMWQHNLSASVGARVQVGLGFRV